MKKLFTLLMACGAAMSAKAATALDFDCTVNNADLSVTVTASDEVSTFYVCALSDYYWNYYQSWGYTSSDEILFQVVTMLNTTEYTGSATLTNYDDKGQTFQLGETYHVVAYGGMKDESGEYVATQGKLVETVTFTVEEPDPIVVDPLTFTFAADAENFTITPSSDESPYFFWVIPEEEMAYVEEAGYTPELYIKLMCAGITSVDVNYGEVTNNGVEDWYLEEPGLCYVGVVEMKEEERNTFYPTGEVSFFEWHYGDNVNGIEQLTEALKADKALCNGRIVLRGKYGINGILVK